MSSEAGLQLCCYEELRQERHVSGWHHTRLCRTSFALPLCLQSEVLVRLGRPLGWRPPLLPLVSGVEIVSQGAAGSDKPEPSFLAGSAGGDAAAGTGKGFVPQGASRQRAVAAGCVQPMPARLPK